MQSIYTTVLCALIAITGFAIAGCQPTTKETEIVAEPEVDLSNHKLVSLSVPKMTCGACASAVWGALKKIDGVAKVEAVSGSRACSFWVPKELDVEAKLAELSVGISEFEDYSFISDGSSSPSSDETDLESDNEDVPAKTNDSALLSP